MKKSFSTKGFTLAEVLVAMSLFSIVCTIAATVLVDVVQLQKKSSIQNEIYEDARILMQQLTNEIQSGTIDYEEYYSVNVVQKKKLVTGGPFLGINYGVYGSRFFDPGRRLDLQPAKNPEDLGIECSYPRPGNPDYNVNKSCDIYFGDSTDLNTGQNPYKNNPDNYSATEANALCDNKINPNSCAAITSGKVSDLYLIDSSGTHKTIIGQKNITSGTCGKLATSADCAVAMIKMTGQDLDQNGIIDVFSCDADYGNCIPSKNAIDIAPAFQYPFIINQSSAKDYLYNNNIRIPQRDDLKVAYNSNTSQFIPITPSRANVKALSFTINPLDDPYKAYAETGMQTQPTVTISMTIDLASAYKSDYPGAFPAVTLQTTVTAGVIGKIDSYPPVNDILREDGKRSWIYNVFN
ncbi:MAG: type II secretion system protein [Candidatus Peregrinibacteria bacterium]|nr:type II secretion system protein [Candidatus Peregrinibacteria bacterium]